MIDTTDFHFAGQKNVYHGKVRDVYDLGDHLLMIASDRYSAFDRILALIPHKGELLTATSRWWFEQTQNIVRNHTEAFPDPNVMYCKKYTVIPIEMVVRGYITGVTNTSLWHTYSAGQRDYGTFALPDGLKKNDPLPAPVLTPTTKFEVHDRNVTPDEAVKEGLLDAKTWEELSRIALELFAFGQKAAAEKGLLLVDTKYEFGLDTDGSIVLIDEIHTQDSSRYWLQETYKEKIAAGEEPDNYDKEFLRLWFKSQFDPYADSEAPEVPADKIAELTRRYTYVYEQLSGQKFVPSDDENPLERMETNMNSYLAEAK